MPFSHVPAPKAGHPRLPHLATMTAAPTAHDPYPPKTFSGRLQQICHQPIGTGHQLRHLMMQRQSDMAVPASAKTAR